MCIQITSQHIQWATMWKSLSCLTLCKPMDYTVHGTLQARILKWVAFPFSRGSSQPRDQTQVYVYCRQIVYQLSHKGSPRILEWVAYPFPRGSFWPRNQTGVSYIAGGFFTNWAIREAQATIRQRLITAPNKSEWLQFHFHALEKEMATHSSVLAWRIPGTGKPGGLLSMGPHRVRHDWSDLVVVVNLTATIRQRIITPQ